MPLNQTLNPKQLHSELAECLNDQWAFYLGESIVPLMLGMLTIIVPAIATISVRIGCVFFATGVTKITTFTGCHAPGFWCSLISALLGIFVGLLWLVWPIGGALALTLVLISFLIADGIVSILFGLAQRQRITGQ
jgi:uncharacterized membrane protein HdeD (DUF308 family)